MWLSPHTCNPTFKYRLKNGSPFGSTNKYFSPAYIRNNTLFPLRLVSSFKFPDKLWGSTFIHKHVKRLSNHRFLYVIIPEIRSKYKLSFSWNLFLNNFITVFSSKTLHTSTVSPNRAVFPAHHTLSHITLTTLAENWNIIRNTQNTVKWLRFRS